MVEKDACCLDKDNGVDGDICKAFENDSTNAVEHEEEGIFLDIC